MKEGVQGNKSYNVWIRDWTFLLVNYTGYKNDRLVHKQQPADSAAPGRQVVVAPQVICSKPQPQVSRPQHSLKVNSSRRQEAIDG